MHDQNSQKSMTYSCRNVEVTPKKTNFNVAMQSNSFKIVGSLLIVIGIVNLYSSSLWLSTLIVFTGIWSSLKPMKLMGNPVNRSFRECEHDPPSITALREASITSTLKKIISITCYFRAVYLDCSFFWTALKKGWQRWDPANCFTTEAWRKHCKCGSSCVWVDPWSCYTTFWERTEDDRYCR